MLSFQILKYTHSCSLTLLYLFEMVEFLDFVEVSTYCKRRLTNQSSQQKRHFAKKSARFLQPLSFWTWSYSCIVISWLIKGGTSIRSIKSIYILLSELMEIGALNCWNGANFGWKSPKNWAEMMQIGHNFGKEPNWYKESSITLGACGPLDRRLPPLLPQSVFGP